jgi:hypothetical protein
MCEIIHIIIVHTQPQIEIISVITTFEPAQLGAQSFTTKCDKMWLGGDERIA